MRQNTQIQISSKERFEICKSCEFLRRNSTCKKCNCFMPVKVQVPFLHCPINKW